MTILGIDLGTTNSACAIWQNGKPTLIPNRLGTFLTPSVVGIDDSGEVLVGDIAKHRLISQPSKTVSVFKRYMGTDYSIKLGKQTFTAPELSALVLRSLKEDAETYLGEPITDAVISVPAYFNDVQRKATKLGGELAGLKVERLINEPTAAAMVYGLHDKTDGEQFLILDMGGGTFDVSLVEYFSGVLEVHASSGDNHLGGEDFLMALAEYYFKQTGVKKNKLKASELQHLYNHLEMAKREVNNHDKILIDNVVAAQKEPFTLSRDDFNHIAQALLNKVLLPIERTLRDANISPSEIDEVVLVGGATRMHAFRSMVSKMFRRMPAANIDPDLVVAMGAGIQAGLKQKHEDLDDIVLTDVCPYTLGTGILNEEDKSGKHGSLFCPIIERNSIVPVSIEKQFFTAQKNQKKVEIDIYQGESRLVKNNILLGKMDVQVPKGPAGQESMTVRYSYDMNGLLEVDIVIDSTGEKYNTTIINNPGGLSDKEIEASRNKLSELKFHPRENEENRSLLARAERLYETSLGDLRDYIGNAISQFENILEKQNIKEINIASQNMKDLLNDLESDNLFS